MTKKVNRNRFGDELSEANLKKGAYMRFQQRSGIVCQEPDLKVYNS